MTLEKARVRAIAKAQARVAPRRSEVDEIVKILESDGFTSAEQMARKVMATAFALIGERNWFVIANKIDPGGPVSLYGLFATESAAQKALDDNSLSLVGQAGIYELHGLSLRADYLNGLDADSPLDCDACGHAEVAHDWPRAKVLGCVVEGCSCTRYERPRRAAEPLGGVDIA